MSAQKAALSKGYCPSFRKTPIDVTVSDRRQCDNVENEGNQGTSNVMNEVSVVQVW